MQFINRAIKSFGYRIDLCRKLTYLNSLFRYFSRSLCRNIRGFNIGSRYNFIGILARIQKCRTELSLCGFNFCSLSSNSQTDSSYLSEILCNSETLLFSSTFSFSKLQQYRTEHCISLADHLKTRISRLNRRLYLQAH